MSLEEEIKKQKRKNRDLKNKGQSQKVYNLIKDDYEYMGIEPKGERTSICNKCNKEFEQDFIAERNIYSEWKSCPSCRKLLAEKKAEKIKSKGKEKEVHVGKLPYHPFPWQQEAEKEFEKHRFIVLACGNRCGKDRATIMMGIQYFVECLNENRAIDRPDLVPPVLWWQIAPTEKMAKQNWRELKTYFPKEWVVARSDSSYQMETIGGGVIEVRSGYDPDALVGVGLDLVTITEAARFKDLSLVWANLEARLNSAGRGRMQDHGGKAIINSSPLGKNDFYDMFCYGQKNHDLYDSNWWSAQYPWTANPEMAEKAREIVHTRYGDITYEESLRRRNTDRVFRSNYLADFLADDYTVFKTFEDKCVVNVFDPELKLNTKAERNEYIKTWQTVEPGAEYVIGYDPATGSSEDNPVCVVRNKNSNRVVRIFDLYGKSYEKQWDFIANMCKYYNYAPVNWLRTGHTAIEGQFEKRGITGNPLDEQGGKKGQLVQTLELAVENGDVKVLLDGSREAQTLIYQMSDYTEKKGKYANDKQPHDDFVSAMYAAFADYSASEIPIAYCNLMGAIR